MLGQGGSWIIGIEGVNKRRILTSKFHKGWQES
jgi:hypothetical protein